MGLRIGQKFGSSWVGAKAEVFVEAGGYGTVGYEFDTGKSYASVGLYVRGVLNTDTFWGGTKRDQVKYTWGGDAADF